MTTDPEKSVGSGAYVLNALDENERKEFEAQLAESEELRNEVTELTDTAVLLGLAVEPVAPSAGLRDSIMAQVAMTPQLPRDIAPVRTLRVVPALTSVEGTEDVHPSALNEKTRVRWFTRPAVAITSVAAAVLLVVGGILGANIALQHGGTSQQAEALASITTASDEQQAASSVSTGGKATLVWSDKLGKSAIIVNNLTKLADSKTYQAWYINSKGVPTSAGTFQSDGKRTLLVLSGSMSKGDTIGVTVEPAGGSKAPTTKPIVAIPSA